MAMKHQEQNTDKLSCILQASRELKGTPYRFPHGNTKEISNMRCQSLGKPMDISHNIFQRIQPHVYSWTKIYGMNFLNWHGSQAQLFVTEPELIREILNNREGAYPKMDMAGYSKKNRMIPEMSISVEMMLERWIHYEGKEINVHKEFEV
ncbi:unnamed protein product [Ilex paraguariensis]|uniref:Uncharacterized protein n=1 Tax=Ilex paraguariensis TaxID=185542 RepID=A0ABC8RBX0_9AQUA